VLLLAAVNALPRRLKLCLLLIQVSLSFLILILYQIHKLATAVATNQVVLTTRPVITTTEAVPTQTLTTNCVASEATLSNGSVTVTSVTIGGNSPDTSTGGGGNSGSNNGPIIGGVIGGVVALLILISVIWVLWRRNREMAKQIKANDEEEKRNGIINVEELLPSPYVQVRVVAFLLTRHSHYCSTLLHSRLHHRATWDIHPRPRMHTG
jgi:hypothetical protein